jgi:hypothetical protein
MASSIAAADRIDSGLADDGRRHGRHRVMLAARIYSVHGESSAVLLDLSEGGAMLSCNPPLPTGCKLLVVRTGLEAPGMVAWTEGHRFGVRFDEPLNQYEVDQLTSRSAASFAH